MSEEKEFSKGGSQIHRYSEEDFAESWDDLGESSVEEIDEHISRFVGEPSFVLHEVVSPTVHIDVHVVEPTKARNFYTLVTSGMSDKPMKSPFDGLEFAELVICLPPSWKVTEDSIHDERYYWPIRQLKYLARLPHEFNTWLWATHTIPNGDPPKPYADNTQLCCALLAYPRLFGEGFWMLPVQNTKTIHFLSVIPIYAEEMEFKLNEGVDALYTRFDQQRTCELLDIARPSVC